jgi:hypothetical protein
MSKKRSLSDDDDGLQPFDQQLMDAYVRIGTPVDRLAYTDDFDRRFESMGKKGDRRTKAEIFRRLLNLRKGGLLPLLDIRRWA